MSRRQEPSLLAAAVLVLIVLALAHNWLGARDGLNWGTHQIGVIFANNLKTAVTHLPTPAPSPAHR